MAAYLVIIPLQPSPMDVWAAADTVDLIREVEMYNPSLRCCLVLNRKVAGTVIGRDVRHALKELGVPVLSSDIGQRIAFAETAASGETVLGQKRSKAAKEVRRFVDELEKAA